VEAPAEHIALLSLNITLPNSGQHLQLLESYISGKTQ